MRESAHGLKVLDRALEKVCPNAFVVAATHRAATVQEVATLKRIEFELQTFLIATLRQSVERTDDTQEDVHAVYSAM